MPRSHPRRRIDDSWFRQQHGLLGIEENTRRVGATATVTEIEPLDIDLRQRDFTTLFDLLNLFLLLELCSSRVLSTRVLMPGLSPDATNLIDLET